MLRDVSSAAAAYALRCRHGQADLRNFRTNQFIEDLGAREGKVTFYSVSEVVQIAAAMALREHGMKAGAAFAVARKHAAQIRAAISPDAVDPILTIAFKDRPSDEHNSEVPAPGAEIAGTARVALGLNIAQIAADVSARLREYAAHETHTSDTSAVAAGSNFKSWEPTECQTL